MVYSRPNALPCFRSACKGQPQPWCQFYHHHHHRRAMPNRTRPMSTFRRLTYNRPQLQRVVYVERPTPRRSFRSYRPSARSLTSQLSSSALENSSVPPAAASSAKPSSSTASTLVNSMALLALQAQSAPCSAAAAGDDHQMLPASSTPALAVTQLAPSQLLPSTATSSTLVSTRPTHSVSATSGPPSLTLRR